MVDARDRDILTYGFVSLMFSATRAIDEASHPAVYHMPDVISFDHVELDTDQSNWLLHGVSNRAKVSRSLTQLAT